MYLFSVAAHFEVHICIIAIKIYYTSISHSYYILITLTCVVGHFELIPVKGDCRKIWPFMGKIYGPLVWKIPVLRRAELSPKESGERADTSKIASSQNYRNEEASIKQAVISIF